MSYYPVFLDIQDRICVVIGGGTVASRKVNTLLDHGAQVTVISPRFCPEIDELVSEGKVSKIARGYRPGDLESAFVVIAATDDTHINQSVADEAGERGTLLNVVDVPHLCNFILPSTLRRGDLTCAISTNGKSPALARKIRSQLEEHFDREYAILVSLIDEVRCELKDRDIVISSDRWQQALDLDVLLDLLGAGKRQEARERLLANLQVS